MCPTKAGIVTPTLVCVFLTVLRQQVPVMTYKSSTTKQGLCRLLSHSKECSSNDTAAPLAVDFAGAVSIPTAVQYQQYPGQAPTASMANGHQ